MRSVKSNDIVTLMAASAYLLRTLIVLSYTSVAAVSLVSPIKAYAKMECKINNFQV